MSDIGRANLFGKLNPFLYETLEQATGFCRLRGNPYVELAHWFKQMLQRPDGDLQRVLRHFGVDDAAIDRLVTALDKLPRARVRCRICPCTSTMRSNVRGSTRR